MHSVCYYCHLRFFLVTSYLRNGGYTLSRHNLRKELESKRESLTYFDYYRLLKSLHRHRDSNSTGWQQRLAAAEDFFHQRAHSIPQLSIDAQLPIADHTEKIIEALNDHQLIVVAGETGSGKSTQLPKIALSAGYGRYGMIGHTQPRRLAARAVAQRVAAELNTSLGDLVGYSVRFDDKTSDRTLVKVMTDGLLLQEISADPWLNKYDLLIIDEAHERSVNIDYILGYLATLLPKRPDLRIIITSATVNTESIVNFFHERLPEVPIIEVAGRTYPIEIRYRPIDGSLLGEDEQHPFSAWDYSNPIEALGAAIDELRWEDKKQRQRPGNILVFLPSEHDIVQAKEKLSGKYVHEEIIVLFSRLTPEEQNIIFTASTKPRIILATNVAETSLTIPGIRYVIDTGTARIARYSTRTKVMRLPIENISQASARQRAGRCGREEPGIVIRLYSETDFLSRPPFTDPEILRSNLSTVLLQLARLQLGPIIDFPFIDAPKESALIEALESLIELEAISPHSTITSPRIKLTPHGKILTNLPIDPRLGRMLIAGKELNVLEEVLIIVSALAVGDMKIRPADPQDNSASIAHAPFVDKESDFMFYVNIFTHLHEVRQNSTYKNFRKQLDTLWLHGRRVKEWTELYKQLKNHVISLGWTFSDAPVNVRTIHQALLTGMTTNIGMRKDTTSSPKNGNNSREYSGAKGLQFHIGYSSHLAKKPPAWIMVFDFVETERTIAHLCGIIEPQWLENLVEPRLKRSYENIHWSYERESCIAWEKIYYLGLPIINKRAVQYRKIDEKVAHEHFIRAALINHEWKHSYSFQEHNEKLVQQFRATEMKMRKHCQEDLPLILFDFYSQHVPVSINDGRSFAHWYKNLPEKTLLELPVEKILSQDIPENFSQLYPDKWRQGPIELPISYEWNHGADEDGVHILIPKKLLAFLSPAGFEWQIPGYRLHLVRHIFENLPKNIRSYFQPYEDNAHKFLSSTKPRSRPLSLAISDFGVKECHYPHHETLLRACSRVLQSSLPSWLTVTFDVVSTHGDIEASGTNIRALQQKYKSFTYPISLKKEITWSGPQSFPDFASTEKITVEGNEVTTHTALYWQDNKLFLASFPHAKIATQHHLLSLQNLIMKELFPQLDTSDPLNDPVLWKKNDLSLAQQLTLKTCPNPTLMLNELVSLTLSSIIPSVLSDSTEKNAVESVRSTEDFSALLAHTRQHISPIFMKHLTHILDAIEQWNQVGLLYEPYLAETSSMGTIARDTAHLREELIGLHFLRRTPVHILSRLSLYAQAQKARLEKLVSCPTGEALVKDSQNMAVLDNTCNAFHHKVPHAQQRYTHPVRWMIEELRISLFAQNLGTLMSVSEKKILQALG